MKTKPVAKAKVKAKREAYKPRRYHTDAEMLAHVQSYMGATHWTIKQVAVNRLEFGSTEHVVFYFKLIPKFKTSVPPGINYQIYDNGTPKAGGRVGN
jgi:hypothetical protein